jgi:predicted nucleotidyltransferase
VGSFVLDPMFWDMEEEPEDSRKKRYRKMGEIITNADKVLKDIEKTIANELQISLPIVPQDPSDKLNAWLDRNSRPPRN